MSTVYCLLSTVYQCQCQFAREKHRVPFSSLTSETNEVKSLETSTAKTAKTAGKFNCKIALDEGKLFILQSTK